MTFNVSRGSHRQAVHQNATLFLYPSKEKYQIKKFVPVIPWIVFLVSAISEWGLDIDFPLTPPAWLLIAVCAVMVAAAHATIRGRSRDANQPAAGSYSFIHSSSLTDAVRPNSIAGNCRATAPVAICHNVNISASEALALPILVYRTGGDVPALTILSPATTRGPPGSVSNFLSVPTSPLCAASRASPFAVEPAIKENHA
jgi:hypothetical protein